jgi:uncharacterized protein YicC (UPF0701 family)
MPTTAPAKRTSRAPAHRSEKSSLDYLQKAVDDLDKARGRASDELRETIDGVIERLRKAASDLRSRAEDETSQWQDTLDRASEDARRELGRRAVRAQRTPEALAELSTEIRKRKAQLG